MSKKRSGRSYEPYSNREPIYLRWLRPFKRFFARFGRRGMSGWLASSLGFLYYLLIRVPMDAVIAAAVQTGTMFANAWRTGSIRRLFYGLPFAGVVAVCGYLLIACSLKSDTVLAAVYSDAARSSMAAQNFPAANLYYERLVGLRGQSNETLYMWALAADQADDKDRVDVLLAILAPEDQSVHAESHLWQAKRELAIQPPTRDSIRAAHAQLLHAVQLKPNSSEIRAILGEFYVTLGDWTRATEHLGIAARQRPEVTMLLAKAHSLQGNSEQAAVFGQRARDFFSAKLVADPTDIESRLRFAEATMFLEKFPESATILRDGMTINNDVRLGKALARVYIAWSDSLTSEAERHQKLQLLEQGLRADPSELILFDRIMKVLRRNDDSAQQARDFLVANIARGQASMISHLLLGTYEGEVGNVDKAVTHLERAYELDSSMSIVANNLAWYLIQRDPPELERALPLAENLAKRWPNVAPFRDTRGTILAKMGRWSEALKDLEAALPQMSGNPNLHATIAECYEQTGMTDLAAEHRKIATQLQKAAAAK